ncbi:Uncharacterised protein [Aeromonas salmonicida]|nr:Uncharacterised protein [Aeromonas salmonicida]SUU70029.1 Uncharacterised protein [Aeromonas salmonicida]
MNTSISIVVFKSFILQNILSLFIIVKRKFSIQSV